MNNPLIKLLVVALVVAGGAGFGYSRMKAAELESKHQIELEKLRREFVDREAFARSIADSTKYADEQRALFKWYFAELTSHYNRYPKYKNYDRFLDDLKARHKSKKVKDGEFGQWEERFKLTRDFFDKVGAGKYEPRFTAVDKGLRFDIYDIQSVPDPKEPKVRLSFALYGAQRKWSEDTSSGSKVSKLTVNANFRDMVFKGLDGQDKEVLQLTASGDPFKIDNPERLVEEFPPHVVLGYYEVPKIPSQAAKVEITFGISTRSVLSGEEAAGEFVWKMPTPDDFKLPAGAAWEGAQEKEREAPEEAAAKPAKGKKRP